MFRSRVVNPRWIAAMRRHGYKGAFELAATVDYLFGYDATAGVVEDWMYEQVAERYALDPETRGVHARVQPVGAARDRRAPARGGRPRAVGRALPRTCSTRLRERYLELEGELEEALGPVSAATGFPFSALVGQEDLRTALLANAVEPGGRRRARARREGAPRSPPRCARSRGCCPRSRSWPAAPTRCDPAAPDPACPAGPHPPDARAERRPVRLVELPVGASTDRVAGSLDLERALTEGVSAFEPGLLAAAHRGVLYVDEVNLLADHLVDLLLDAAALGVNYVEREGVIVRHPARFLLVGTMNPEEGDLRPQLLDRFGAQRWRCAARASRPSARRSCAASSPSSATRGASSARFADEDAAERGAHPAGARAGWPACACPDRAAASVSPPPAPRSRWTGCARTS